MASLVLGVVGSELGSSLLGTGAFLGITGAQLGGAIGAFIGTEIDAALSPGTHRTGPRLADTSLQASLEGAPIPRLYGRVRVAGQVIWASRYRETQSTSSSGGGKGIFGPPASETDYLYSISFAVGLCTKATRIGRIWADGNLLDPSGYTLRFHDGRETQDPDPLIESIEGADNAPAFRGLAYIVFEDMPLAAFGNRIPQLQFEIFHNLAAADPDALENRLTGVALIPGAGEFVYADTIESDDDGEGGTLPLNVHNAAGTSDIDASLDDLTALAPNMAAASLVLGWFGSDLRAGACTVKPGVELASRKTYPDTWRVNGIARADAHLVSQLDSRPAYGGTPSDASVVEAIRNLKTRGLAAMLCPFVFMDIASGNTLTDPYTGAASQPAYPWRGRITCSPAPGAPGSVDGTATATTQVNAFFGSATAADFTVDGESVSWSGGSDWGFRRMALHYALLAVAAGGVDAFLIGSEFRGLTQIRDDTGAYPAVAALKALAADLRAILGSSVKLGYAADWSEYANHQTGGGEVFFHLDPLWSDSNIDFVGIDNYLPLADWRDGTGHLDYDPSGPTAIHDLDYLTSNIRGGEDYDWYYASDADRAAQTRTPITDGAGKPWVWRAKDLWNWWSNTHYDRPGGSESATPTGWIAGSKPVWFTELGCPAIDKGANQPNVFVDPKSSESALPYYSNGERDDLMQRRFLEAHLGFWADSANNPAATLYSGRMVGNIFVWCWDARPYPYFPARADVWGDAANWRLGHWLNGRLGVVPLDGLVEEIASETPSAAIDTGALDGLVTGFAVTDTMSARDALAPLALAFHFDAVESQGVMRCVPRGRPDPQTLNEDDLVIAENETAAFALTRAQETDLPNVSRIAYIDAEADYRQASAEARRTTVLSARVSSSSLPLVMDQGQAIGIGTRLLQDAWVMREGAHFALPPSRIACDPTDEILLAAGGRTHRLRLTQIDDAGARSIDAVATDPSLYEPLTGPSRAPGQVQTLTQSGRAALVFLDLPLLTGSEIAWAPHVAAYASPWPGSVQVMKSPSDSGFALSRTLTRAAVIGRTTADFYSGPLWRWDMVNTLAIRLWSGTLASADDLAVLGGANALAVQNADGGWEVLQFATATLTAPKEWSLTRLLRGQAGSEGAMRAPVAAGAPVVLLDGALAQLDLDLSEATLPFHYAWGPAGKPLSDASWQTAEEQFVAIGLRPYAPVQLAAARSGGDVVLSWIRRTRIGGDSWDQTDVPLGEDSEAYEVDILDSSDGVLRTLSSSTSSLTYTAAQIATDFPSGLPSPLRFIVYQLSPAYGRGVGAEASFYL
ncbi:MAG: glycoside hydrolase/phage tail family protein [Proteobacteria bacterium]|nr:glycoside hydrolase/phage tail family protein [Pseudomonadota bacterium]